MKKKAWGSYKVIKCAYGDCKRVLPAPATYGTPGISLSRGDNKTLICSDCGVREALQPELLSTKFKGKEQLI